MDRRIALIAFALPTLILLATDWFPGPTTALTIFIAGDRVLSVPTPEGFGTESSPRGLLLRPLTVRRAPYDMTVQIQHAAAPPSELPHLRHDAGILMRYRLDRKEGGSGGEEVTLTAERLCEGLPLRLVLQAQEELPSNMLLEPAWAVLRGTTCRLRDGLR